MRVVILTKDVIDVGGTPYKEGSMVEVVVDPTGLKWVRGARHLPLSSNEYRVPTLDEELTFLQTHEDRF